MDGLTMPPNSSMQVFTAEERPDLWTQANSGFAASWPEYNMHGNHTALYFGELVPRFARFQVLVYDRSSDRVVGRGRSIPLRWDGTLADLPSGIDAAGLRAVTARAGPTALSALAAEVEGDLQGRGLSRVIIQAMAAAARGAGLDSLIAPVRPSWKDRYPLIPIAIYATGDAPIGCHSTRGCGYTHDWARRCCDLSRNRWRSARRSPSGRNGPVCCCPNPANTSSPAGSPR
jgi:hypothetical protein